MSVAQIPVGAMKPCSDMDKKLDSASRTVSSRRTAVVARTAALQAGTQLLSKALAPKGDVFVSGATGSTSVRIIQQLTASGLKVVAGVPDLEEGEAVLAFAQRYGLLDKTAAAAVKLVEADPADAEALQAVIPRGARVLVVEGDSLGRRKIDGKCVTALLEAADAKSASSFVLVSAAGAGGGGGGGGFSLFGGGGGGGGGGSGRGARLNRSEAAVADSGLKFAVVRANGLDKTDDSLAEETGVAIGIAGSFPPSALSTKSQVAEVVAALMKRGGGGYVVELAASTDAVDTPVTASLAQVLGQLDAAAAAEEAAAEQERSAAEAAQLAAEKAEADKDKGFSFNIGTRRVKGQVEDARATEEVEEVKKPAPPAFFGFGARKPAPEPEEEEEEEEAPAKRAGSFFLFGGPKKVVEEEEEEEEEPSKKKGGSFFLFGGGKKEEEEEEEEEVKPKSLFSFGRKKAAEPAAASGRGKPATVRGGRR